MLVDELYRKSVCYVVAERWDENKECYEVLPEGTAFFVVEHVKTASLYYAVTARHVVEGIKRDNKYRNMFFRANTLTRKSLDIPIQYQDWVFHKETDVAVCSISFDPSVDTFPLFVGSLGANAVPGHDVFFIGLFSSLPGEQSVNAIVRFGKIAHPLTRVPIADVAGDVRYVDAYLVESRSWGGESGSPVFLYDEHYAKPYRSPLDSELYDYYGGIQESRITSSQVRPNLLGLLHGHFEINRHVRTSQGQTTGEVDVNSGIAVVIPASKIIQTLSDPVFEIKRQEIRDRVDAS